MFAKQLNLSQQELQSLDYIILAGPTGVGKSRAALELADAYPALFEIVSVDSVQIYRGCDIGSAKPTMSERARVPHHLLDICHVTDRYTAAQFVNDASAVIQSIRQRHRIALLSGGTFLYLQAFLEGLSPIPDVTDQAREQVAEILSNGLPAAYKQLIHIDPVSARLINQNDRCRIERALLVYYASRRPISYWRQQPKVKSHAFNGLFSVIQPSCRQVLKQSLSKRFDLMLSMGLVEEVQSLCDACPTLNAQMPSMRSIGYRQVLRYLQGASTHDEMRRDAIVATHRYLKRQLTWLRSMQGITHQYQGFNDWKRTWLP